jgi:hypothetical protein
MPHYDTVNSADFRLNEDGLHSKRLRSYLITGFKVSNLKLLNLPRGHSSREIKFLAVVETLVGTLYTPWKNSEGSIDF